MSKERRMEKLKLWYSPIMPILYNSENEWTISIQFNMDDVQNMGGRGKSQKNKHT